MEPQYIATITNHIRHYLNTDMIIVLLITGSVSIIRSILIRKTLKTYGHILNVALKVYIDMSGLDISSYMQTSTHGDITTASTRCCFGICWQISFIRGLALFRSSSRLLLARYLLQDIEKLFLGRFFLLYISHYLYYTLRVPIVIWAK